jgi:hypothetical protein
MQAPASSYDFIYCASNPGVVSPSKRAVSSAEFNVKFPLETRVVAMEHQLLYPVLKRFGSRFRGYNFRPVVSRIFWGINILLFASVFWAFMFCLRNLD